MFNSPIVNLALALSFTYFILSLIVSTVHEYIYSVLTCKRGIYLKKAIMSLFFDTAWGGADGLATKILDNAHIKALRTEGNQNPSYIPAKNFALALLDQFRSPGQLLDMNEIRAILTSPTQQLITGEVRDILIGLFERAQGDLLLFQKHIENFYSDAMERAAGVYTRSTKKVILVISLCIAIIVNADTINIARTLWASPTTLQQTADKVSAAVQSINQQTGGVVPAGITASGGQITVIQSDSTAVDSSDAVTAGKNLAKQIKSTVVFVQDTGIPLGWSMQNIPQGNTTGDIVWGWIFKLFGLALTASALMLGAPFWFDLLNKIVNLRAAGKKPDDNNTSSRATHSDPGTSTLNPVG